MDDDRHGGVAGSCLGLSMATRLASGSGVGCGKRTELGCR
jgi:hypothetical protein